MILKAINVKKIVHMAILLIKKKKIALKIAAKMNLKTLSNNNVFKIKNNAVPLLDLEMTNQKNVFWQNIAYKTKNK